MHLSVMQTSGPEAKIAAWKREAEKEVAVGFKPHALREGADFAGKGVEELALEAEVVEKVREVFDPELPVNVYDLGLIYDIAVSEGREVKVKMTLTAPGCPVAGILPGTVEMRIKELEWVKGAKVELVWEPRWGKEMMSEAARLELGI